MEDDEKQKPPRRIFRCSECHDISTVPGEVVSIVSVKTATVSSRQYAFEDPGYASLCPACLKHAESRGGDYAQRFQGGTAFA